MKSCVLLGHNGAGKSTIIKYILGLYPSVNSHIYLQNLASHFVQIPQDVKKGFAPEVSYLEDNCSANDYIKLFASIRDKDDFVDIAKEVGFTIDLDKKISNYSKGMKQLLSLCLAFMGRPYIVVLDEPTSGLDLFMSKNIQDFIIRKSKNTKLIVSTHSIDFAYNLDLPIIILRYGNIIEYKKFNSYDELKSVFWSAKP